jgi:signal transduction histidine kinase
MQSNILFIDDESGVLDALEWTFADEPYECMTCKTAGEALKLMEETDFAVVVSDQRMPEMDGTEFLEKIRHQWPSTIRILMTAYQEMNIVLDAVNKGNVYNLIFKPWDEIELKRIIKTAVDDHRLKNAIDSAKPLTSGTEQLTSFNYSLELKNHYLMERLQQAQKMEALGNLASGIAHDFNNIIHVIDGCLNLVMVDTSLAPGVASKLVHALKASNRAKGLTSQILSFSRAGESSKEPVKLGPLVREVLEFIQAALPANIELNRVIDINAEKIQLNPTKVYQILMNLCSNAADAIDGNKGIIQITVIRTGIHQVEQVEQMKLLPGEYFCLTVTDNGPGIDESNIERIFDPYYTTKQKNGGTGLGLALINQIVQDHGGRISAQSQIGKGTKFHVYLPLIED